MQLPSGFTIHEEVPGVEAYCRLRRDAGLTPRSEAAAAAGLPNTVFAVTIRNDGETIGMGRVIGDGTLFLQIVDIAIDPKHQGMGLGKAVMSALMDFIKRTSPGEVYVSLMADGAAHRLYSQFGFEPVAPKSQGMAVWVNR